MEVLSPGCDPQGLLKRWGASNYAELTLLLHKCYGYHVVLISAQTDLEECRAIENQVNAVWLVNA